ncbi:AMP-binding protein [Williamsia soli]|uniref:AMP-binding protein n=1 Tax=Williamsia soli TaxID=364929 RepID=UPI001A9EDB91|nr:AMP-binding protein [Williamsia soli]
MGAAQLNTILDDAVDRHYCRPAVVCGDHETDFERFDEAVQWLSDDLAARGVQPRQRVGICIHGGWEFLLAFHALVRLGTVVVPIDPFDETAAIAAGDLDLHFLVSHHGDDCLLEETVEVICGDNVCPMFDVAEEFTLIVVAAQSELHVEAGLFLNDLGYRFWPDDEVADRISGLQANLDLNSGARAAICGPWSSPSAVLLVLACAASASCVHTVPPFGDSGLVWGEMAAGDVSVLFAPPLLMHDLVRVADSATWAASRPRMVLPDGEVLPEVVLRRRGLTRQTPADPPVYEFMWDDGYAPAQLRPVS